MLRRLVPVTLALGLCLTAIAASPASAWSNGSHGPNSFGTHDWVLREGVLIVSTGPRGRRLDGSHGRWRDATSWSYTTSQRRWTVL
jgi:hypothetical protein